MKPYKFMCSLYGHTADVKCLCSTKENGGFASVSRDLSSKIWQLNSNQYSQSSSISFHKKYVNSVVIVYTLDAFPQGLIVTGSNDQTIAIHCIETSQLITQLKEHEGAGSNDY